MIKLTLENRQYQYFTEHLEMLIYSLMISQEINPIKVAEEIKEVVKQFALAYRWNDGGVCTTLNIVEKDGKCEFSIDQCDKEEDADGGVIGIYTEKIYRCDDDNDILFESKARYKMFDDNMCCISSYTQHGDNNNDEFVMKYDYTRIVEYQSKEVKDKKIVKELQEEKKKLMDKINEAQDNKSDVQPLIDRMVEIDDEINKHMNELPF